MKLVKELLSLNTIIYDIIKSDNFINKLTDVFLKLSDFTRNRFITISILFFK